jgi:hypothetical protein
MRDLCIYHPGTGTLISLSDPVYLVNAATASQRDIEKMENGSLDRFASSVIGIRIDNTNMGNIFYGKETSNA